MRIITRYLLSELGKTFAVTMLSLSALWLCIGVIREAVEQGLGPGHILRVVPYLLPEALRFTIPAALLFSICGVYGRMAADNEFVALKSAGIPPDRLLLLGCLMAAILSHCTVWMTDVAAHWGRQGARSVVLGAVDEIILGVLRTQRAYSTDNMSIVVKAVEGDLLVQPTVALRNGGQSVVIRAAEGELKLNAGDEQLVFLCRDGYIDFGEGRLEFPDAIEQVLPLHRATQFHSQVGSASWLPLAEIPAAIEQQRAHHRSHLAMLARLAGEALMVANYDALLDEHWQQLPELERSYNSRLARLELEPQRRYSGGWSCLCFALVGAPLAMLRRYANVWTSFFMVFLPVLLVYYPLMFATVNLCKGGRSPVAVLWLGNGLFVAAGLILWRRVRRH